MASVLLRQDDREVLTASPVEVDQARAMVNTLSADATRQPAVEATAGNAVAMPHELSLVVTRVLEVLSSGGTVTVGAMPQNLTTTAAAGLLGVSRPTLIKMIDRGEICAHKVGSHSRLRTQEVLEVRADRRTKQREAFAALRALEDD